MILVDTSVWIDHFREGLNQNKVLIHAFVVGELARGNLKSRRETITLLSNLPKAPKATDAEVMGFIDSNHLMGKGIGFIDAHLLASVALAADAKLWTHDK